jgi:hypothetical protein
VENRIRHHREWAGAAVKDILHFSNEAGVKAAVESQLSALDHYAEFLSRSVVDVARRRGLEGDKAPPLPRARDDRIPVRLTRGPLGGGLPASGLEGERAEWHSSPRNPLRGNYAFELVNFIDGERSVTEIRDALSAEFGPVPTQAVARFLEDMVAVGVAKWR